MPKSKNGHVNSKIFWWKGQVCHLVKWQAVFLVIAVGMSTPTSPSGQQKSHPCCAEWCACWCRIAVSSPSPGGPPESTSTITRTGNVFFFHFFSLTCITGRFAKLGWHSDDEGLHFDRRDLDYRFYSILSWSFGSPRKFLVKHKRTSSIHTIVVQPGDVYCMNGDFQSQYLHWWAPFFWCTI